MAEVTPPLFLDVDTFYGADELGLPYRDLIGEGVMGYEDHRVRQRAAGANMSVDVGAGVAWIMGDESLAQPRYRCYNDAVKNVVVTAADATNPRIDLVISEVRDATFAGAFSDWRFRVVAGTPSAGATLDNRTGAAALPNNSILLADLLIPATDTTVGDAEIRDRRPFGAFGTVPPVLTKVDMVSLIPHSATKIYTAAGSWNHTVHDLQQAAALFYLPRRIVSATRIRWRYAQGGGPLVGNYNIGIYDASGRLVISTGVVAATGAGSTFQERSETITATTFEAGFYYVCIGLDSTSGDCAFWGMGLDLIVGTTPGTAFRNVGLRAASGGTTLPTTLLAMSDVGAASSAITTPAVPAVALSVG